MSSVAVVVAAGLLVGVRSADAATTFTVSTRADEVSPTDGSCSLREAVTAANSGMPSGATAGECPAGDPGANTIVLAGGAPYTLTLAGGGALQVRSTLTISGAGAAITTIDGGGIDRVLDIGAAPAVSVAGVTIRGGHAPDGVVSKPEGQSGGGIRNTAVLTLTDTKVIGNQAGAGLMGSTPVGASGTVGGSGGGVYNTGVLTLVRTTVAGNSAGNGGQGEPACSCFGSVVAAGPGGRGGSAGGVYNANGATLTVVDSSITSNRAGAGGPGGDNSVASQPGGAGAAGGTGGGVWNAGTLSVTTSAVTGNAAGRGGPGGTGLDMAAGGAGGAGGFGGGVFDSSATSQTINNSTIAANSAGAGGDGMNGGYGGDGGGGGGVVSANAALRLLNVTVSANHVGAGGGDGGGGPGGIGGGGGINAFGSATIENTIVADNSGSNCVGAVTDGGHNLSFPDATCVALTGDPKLGTLQDNGGPTQTMALEAGSAAIDQIPATGAGCPATDQRGVTRPQPPGGSCDIGAYEFVLPSCQSFAVTTAVGLALAVQLSCTDLAGARLSYAIDADPTHGLLNSLNPATGTVTYTPNAGYHGADQFAYHATSGNGTAATRTVTITVTAPSVSPSVAPQLRALRVTPSEVTAAGSGGSITEQPAGNKRTKKQKQTGASVSYTDTEAAHTTFTVLRSVPGIALKRGCVAAARQPHKPANAKRCVRLVAVGSFSHQDRAGANNLHFSGRVKRHKLTPGKYRLRAVPIFAGRSGAPVTTSFRVAG